MNKKKIKVNVWDYGKDNTGPYPHVEGKYYQRYHGIAICSGVSSETQKQNIACVAKSVIKCLNKYGEAPETLFGLGMQNFRLVDEYETGMIGTTYIYKHRDSLMSNSYGLRYQYCSCWRSLLLNLFLPDKLRKELRQQAKSQKREFIYFGDTETAENIPAVLKENGND